MTLIIDAGHGGKDSGGGSNQYWLEKEKALEISLYQFKRFKELGVEVALTRDEDIYLSPAVRTEIVRKSGAQYCISNHINAGGGDGFEAIHSIYSDGELANAFAAAIQREDQNVRRVFTRKLPYNANKDYYFMHRDTGAVETVINEYGFADSQLDDIKQLQENWKEYAESIVKAFCKHIGHKYIPPSKNVSEWAIDAYKWVTEPSVNLSDGKRPKDPITREEVWVMSHRFFRLIKRLLNK